MDLTSSYFDVFNLPVSFEVDEAELADRYRTLQQQFHPDKYVQQSAQQQRVAEQYTAFINQAYTTLKKPLLRAQYLLELQNVDASHESSTHQDMEFLMEQMQLREALSDIPGQPDPLDQLMKLSQQVANRYQELLLGFETAYNAADYDAAREEVAKMQFFQKLQNQIDDLEVELDDF